MTPMHHYPSTADDFREVIYWRVSDTLPPLAGRLGVQVDAVADAHAARLTRPPGMTDEEWELAERRMAACVRWLRCAVREWTATPGSLTVTIARPAKAKPVDLMVEVG